jgi:hypothetical protein
MADDEQLDKLLKQTEALIKSLFETIEGVQDQALKYRTLFQDTVRLWDGYSSKINSLTSAADTDGQIEGLERKAEEYRRNADKVLEAMNVSDEAIDELLRAAREKYPN